MAAGLTLDAKLSGDGRYLDINPEVRFVVYPEYYSSLGVRKIGLLPKDIEFSDEDCGLDKVVTENLGIEVFGNVTMISREGYIGQVDFTYLSKISRGDNSYIIRHAKYRHDDMYTLYLLEGEKTKLLGLADINFEDEKMAKILGICIKEEYKRQGHGTVFLAALERESKKTNIIMTLWHPLRTEIGFYIANGYRLLEHSDGPEFAKALNPIFDEKLLIGGEIG